MESLPTIEADDLEVVAGGVSEDALFNFFAPIFANGAGSFFQSLLLGGDDPVADGLLGLIKGATAPTGGPVQVNSYGSMQDSLL